MLHRRKVESGEGMINHEDGQGAQQDDAQSRLFAGPGEMRAACRAFDWSATPLGRVEGWPHNLRTTVQIVLAVRLPMLVFWGPQMNAIYNDGFRDMIGLRHPAALGQPSFEFWPEYREHHEQVFARVRAGETVSFDDAFFPIRRSEDVFDDAWFDVSYSPVFDDAGAVAGVLAAGVETTAQKKAEAGQAVLLELTDRLRTLEDPTVLQQTACCLLGEHLGLSRCLYADIEGDDFILRPGYVSGVPPMPSGRQPIRTFAASVLEACRRGETIVIDDVATESRLNQAEREALRLAQMGALSVMMLVKGGRLVGTFAMQSTTPRHWTELELELQREVADRTWAAMVRAQAEVALRVSEEQMRLAMEAATMVHWTLDVATGHTTWSSNCAEVLGFSPQPGPMTLLERIHSRAHPEDSARLREALGKTMRGEDDAHVEYRMCIPNSDDVVWTEVHATRVVDATTGTVRLIGVMQNITPRKRAEQALREAEARQAFLLELSDRLRMLTDPRAIMNTAAEMLGRQLGVAFLVYRVYDEDGDTSERAAVYSDGSLPDIVGNAPFRLSENAPGWAQAMRSGQEIFSEDVEKDQHLVLNDARRPFKMRATAAIPLIKQGRIVAALILAHVEPRRWSEADKQLCREVAERTWSAAERARVENALRVSEEHLRRAMILRDEFLAVVSHELRTPLSAILIWAKMLRAGAVKAADQPQALSVIEQSALAQRQLINDLLDVSGMLAGKMRIETERSEMGPLLSEGLAAVRPMAEGKHVTLSVDLGTAPVWANVDRARFQQVMWNLANNAVKFTPAGGQVSVRLRECEQVVQIEFQDTGCGIAPSFLPHIFERFRQADASTTRSHGGLGLGLAIVRQLIELHGGTIEARSEGNGKGATFVVELPRLEMASASSGSFASQKRRAQPSAPFVPRPVLAGVRVLFVEDEAHTRAGVQWVLEQCGADVTSAPSAAEALSAFDALAEDRRFDVLVSDVGLAEKDGYELLADVRRRAKGAALPALALTAYARDEDKRHALAAGFTAYLAKPVEPNVLVETIAAIVRGSDADERFGAFASSDSS
jgi:PAS domain S-box-containing protein